MHNLARVSGLYIYRQCEVGPGIQESCAVIGREYYMIVLIYEPTKLEMVVLHGQVKKDLKGIKKKGKCFVIISFMLYFLFLSYMKVGCSLHQGCQYYFV